MMLSNFVTAISRCNGAALAVRPIADRGDNVFGRRLWQITRSSGEIELVGREGGGEAALVTFLQQLINGISQGSAYALIALGYTMVYGVLRPDQFCAQRRLHVRRVHGLLHRQQPLGSGATWDIVAVQRDRRDAGAQWRSPRALGILIERFAYRPGRTQTRFTLAFWLGILGAAFGQLIADSVVCGNRWARLSGIVVGIVVGTAGLRPVQQDSRLALLIIAIGVSLFLENGGQLVFGADPKFFPEIIPTTSLERRCAEARQPEAHRAWRFASS